MGYYRNSVLAVVGNTVHLAPAHALAKAVFGARVTAITPGSGRTATFFVAGLGLKVGSPAEGEDERRRADFISRMDALAPRGILDWIEIRFGEDTPADVLSESSLLNDDGPLPTGPPCRICGCIRAASHTDVCLPCWDKNDWCRTGPTYENSPPNLDDP